MRSLPHPPGDRLRFVGVQSESFGQDADHTAGLAQRGQLDEQSSAVKRPASKPGFMPDTRLQGRVSSRVTEGGRKSPYLSSGCKVNQMSMGRSSQYQGEFIVDPCGNPVSLALTGAPYMPLSTVFVDAAKSTGISIFMGYSCE